MRSRSRSRLARGPQRLESLEARIVFDAAPAVEYAPLDTFESDQALIDRLLADHRSEFDRDTSNSICHPHNTLTYPLADLAFRTLTAAADMSSGAPAHTTTNVQVAGVDEADLVETDGQYIYAFHDQMLVIVDSWPVEDLRVVSRTQLSGRALAMFLEGDRLVVISESSIDFNGEQNHGRGIVVTALDITDRAHPELISATALEGVYVNARMIDGRVYLQSFHNFTMPAVQVLDPQGNPVQPNGIGQRPSASDNFLIALDSFSIPAPRFDDCESLRYETWDEYTARVSETLIQDALADYRTLDAEGNVVAEGLLVSSDDVHAGYGDGGYLRRLTTVTVIDALGETAAVQDASSVFTRYVPTMYATTDSIVLAGNRDPSYRTTTLFKLDIGADDVTWSASGIIAGRVFDQFSIDIHGDHMRVATSGRGADGLRIGQDVAANLWVLEQQGQDLNVVGSLVDFAPGESVFGVRFMGDHAFAITASPVMDPLFSFDLSDPADPQILDHLEMPGRSEYLHPIGSEFLIGLGVDDLVARDADPRLSLFRVDDLPGLSVAEHEVFTYAAVKALYEQQGEMFDIRPGRMNIYKDHHAFTYDSVTGILTVPLSYQLLNRTHTADLLVIKVNQAQATLDTLGVIRHEQAIERSVTIDGKIYSISDETLKVHDPAALDEAIASLNFRDDPIDVNHDGVVAISDMLAVVAELRMMHREGERMNSLRSALQRPDLDVDPDGTVTVADALYIATNLRTRYVTGQFGASTPMPSDSRNAAAVRAIGQPLQAIFDFVTPMPTIAIDQAVLALLAENG